MTVLEEIRVKVIEAVPEITIEAPYIRGGIVFREINLADVLCAMPNKPEEDFWCVTNHGVFLKIDCETGETFDHGESVRWDLALSLDDQQPEVIAFLHKILCV